jgi:hypothetical protein
VVIVEIETGPGGGNQVERGHQGLSAVMPGTDSDIVFVEDCCYVVRMDFREAKGNDPAAFPRVLWSINRQSGTSGSRCRA